jgi:hypothetical protein
MEERREGESKTVEKEIKNYCCDKQKLDDRIAERQRDTKR